MILLELWYNERAWLGHSPISIFNRVAAGEVPFQVPRDAPPPLAALMRECTAADPAQRPSFARILETLYGLTQSLPRPPSSGDVSGSAAAGAAMA